MVAVRYSSIFRKILSLVVIAALLSLRLSSFTEEQFVTPVEDTLFEIPFIAAEGSTAEGKPLKVKPKRAFDIILDPVEGLDQQGERPHPTTTTAVAVLNLKDIHSEIFIPPEVIS